MRADQKENNIHVSQRIEDIIFPWRANRDGAVTPHPYDPLSLQYLEVCF